MEQSLDEITAILSRTPAALRTLLDGLPEALLLANEGEATFSPRDVLGHLIQGDKTDWMVRIKLILDRGGSQPFAPFDRSPFATVSPAGLLDELESTRRSNLADLDGPSSDGSATDTAGHAPGARAGHAGQLLATWAAHDLDHVGQIARVMAKRYATAVGPWKAYLGILNR